MSSSEIVINDTHFDTIDVNIIPDTYVTWIVDIWQGQRHDPAATIIRYIGVWRADDLEDEEGNARDPDFTKYAGRDLSGSYGASVIDPRPLHWEVLENIKDGDRDARHFKDQQANLLGDGYRYGSSLREKEMYQAFMAAIDVLAVDDTDEDAWEAIGIWRNYQATKHEK